MAKVVEHYENHIARYYSWMFGDFNENVDKNYQFFVNKGITPQKSKIAIDLGAGCGFQSLALARLDFSVIALDSSKTLLDELKSHSGNLKIIAVIDNIINFTAHCPEKVELCICMGDTLPHLGSLDEVKKLFEDVYSSLEDRGKCILTFRDLVFELEGINRFIPVKNDSENIFTCILEYEKDHVIVNDMIYKKIKGDWKMDASSYTKLRIHPDWVRKELMKSGFSINLCEIEKGWITVIAGKN